MKLTKRKYYIAIRAEAEPPDAYLLQFELALSSILRDLTKRKT